MHVCSINTYACMYYQYACICVVSTRMYVCSIDTYACCGGGVVHHFSSLRTSLCSRALLLPTDAGDDEATEDDSDIHNPVVLACKAFEAYSQNCICLAQASRGLYSILCAVQLAEKINCFPLLARGYGLLSIYYCNLGLQKGACRVVSCRVVSCRVVSCRVVSSVICHRVVSCRVVSCRVVSCRVVSCHPSSVIVSCRVIRHLSSVIASDILRTAEL